MDPDRTETARGHRQSLPPEARPALLWVYPEWGRVTAPIGRHVIGRSDECDTVLAGTKVSRAHAELAPVGTAFAIRDLGSRNGVCVNGVRLESGATALSYGDVLRLGEWIGVVTSGVDADTVFTEIAPGLLGGPTLAAALAPARKVAEKGMPMVLQGATGTGKERVARAIHALSGRSGEYVGLNCAAIPPELAEAELFGHAKGAFTGADRARLGHFRMAHQGTLLLDEFLELAPALQAKLLRVLEEWEVQPIGESKPQKVDVLVLAATQEPLSKIVQSGQLRNDLVARLGVVTLELPRLSDRKEDILPLFQHFLESERGQAGPPVTIDPDLAEWLCLHRFPQNVRELEWLARAMCAMHDDVECLGLKQLPRGYRDPRGGDVRESQRPPESEDEQLFKQLIQALEQHDGVVLRAADSLGISRQKAYRILQNRDFKLGALRTKRG